MVYKAFVSILLVISIVVVSAKPPVFRVHKIETTKNDLEDGRGIFNFPSTLLNKVVHGGLGTYISDKGRHGRSLQDPSEEDPKDDPQDPLTSDEAIGIKFDPASTTIPENSEGQIHVTVTCLTCISIRSISVRAKVVDESLATISPNEQNMTRHGEEGNRVYSAVFNLTTHFLGVTQIVFTFGYVDKNGDNKPDYYQFDQYKLDVERVRSLIDEIFDIAMQALLVISTATFGCELDLKLMKKYFKRPVGVTVGLLCQYGIMPSLVLFFDYILNIPTFIDYGLLAYASCPGGGASNIYTSLLGGEINLSITMTFVSTVASLAFMPMWMYTAGTALTGAEAQIPFMNIFTGLLMIIIPVFVGIAMKRFLPRFAEIFVKVLRPVSVVGVLFLTAAGFYINFYIIEIVIDYGWTVALPSVILPWLGISLAMLVAFIIRQPWHRIKTIGIETGVQNMPLAVLLLRSSLQSPASQLSAVGPVVAGLATPIPIVTAILIRFCYLRYKGVTMAEKGADDESVAGELDDDPDVEKEQVMDYKLRRLSTLVRRASVFVATAGRPRADTTDTTLSTTTYSLDGRLRADTTDTMLDDFASDTRRKRANTMDTNLSGSSDTDSDVVFEAEPTECVRSEVDKNKKALMTSEALPGIYRSRSDTTDTMLSDAPMMTRMQGRNRTDTLETFLNDSPKVHRKSEADTITEPAPSPKSILRGSKLNNKVNISDHVAHGGTPGTFRRSTADDDVSFSPIMYRKSIRRSDADRKAKTGPQTDPTSPDPQAIMQLKRAQAMEAILVQDTPYSNGQDDNSIAETSLTEIPPTSHGNHGILRRSASAAASSPRSTNGRSSTGTADRSSTSTDTGLGSDFRSSFASSRRRSVSMSSLDTISAYVETLGNESVLSAISVEDDIKRKGLEEGSKTTRNISSTLDVQQSPAHSKLKKTHRSSTSDIPAESNIENGQDAPQESKSASKNLYKLLNKSRVWKMKENDKRTRSSSLNEQDAPETAPPIPNGRF